MIANLKRVAKDIWAAQDRNPLERAARNLCFGLKHLFKNEWNIPYTVRITDEAPYTLTVGGALALTAQVPATRLSMRGMGNGQVWMIYIQVPR